MNLYAIVLFIHVSSALGLAVAVAVQDVAMRHLRHAKGSVEIRDGFALAGLYPRIGGLSMLLLLLSGGYMSHVSGAWALGWVQVGLLDLVAIGAIGGAAITLQLKKALLDLEAAKGAAAEEALHKRMGGKLLVIWSRIRLFLVLGAVALMTIRPDRLLSLLILGGAAVLGFLMGFLVPLRRKS